MWRFQFHKKRQINEEFDFWEDKIISGGPEGGRGTRYQKIEKNLIQNGGPNPHLKFQHCSLIIKCLQIEGTERKKKDILDPILVIFKIP